MRQTWVLEQKALQGMYCATSEGGRERRDGGLGLMEANRRVEAFASSYLKAMEAKQEPMPPNASVPALPVQLSPSQGMEYFACRLILSFLFVLSSSLPQFVLFTSSFTFLSYSSF